MEDRPIDILMVEDNPADVELTKEALEDSKILTRIFVAGDGVEAIEFLSQQGKYKQAVRPDLVFLDLNLPKKDGREVLRQIKNDPYLKSIPVVILSTSDAETDVIKSYNLGANCYVTKPIGLEEFLTIIKTVGDFWFSVVKLPSREMLRQYREIAAAPRISDEPNPFKEEIRVMMIEDNPGDVDLLAELVSTSFSPRIEIHSETTLQKGSDRILNDLGRFDVVLLDLSLPDSTGLETLHQFRSKVPGLPVIVLTGTDDMRLAIRTLRSGAQDYLIKGDFNERGLQRAIRYAMERKWSEEERDVLLAREQAARVDAEKAVFMRDEFISIASHELKTPLTALLPQLEMLHPSKAHPLTLTDKRAQKLLDSSYYQTLRLSRLVNELLDITRIASGHLDLQLLPVNLSALAREVIDRMKGQLDESRSSVKLNVPEPVTGLFDPYRIEQVLVNLFSNALKFGSGQPIEVNILRQPHQQVLISVSDHGIGIPKDKLPKIFDRFERAGVPPNISGLGLGLYIARQIVVAHHGSIRVESEPGKGSTFSVILPCRKEESVPKAA